MNPPKRPPGVPAEAEYFPDWKEWGVGKKVDGKMVGAWKLWRDDGTFVEDSTWVAGKCDGEKRRYHDDGSLASVAQYANDVMGDIVHHRTKKKTREPNFDDLPKQIRVIEFPRRGEWQYAQRFRTADGKEVDLRGEPIPPRPASVPEDAYYTSEYEHWQTGEWKSVDGEEVRRGLYRYFTTTGELVRLEYYVDGRCEASLDTRSAEDNDSDLVIEAAKAKDEPVLKELLGLGLGGASAVLHAQYEGLHALVPRLVGKPALVDGRVAPERRGEIPEDAVFVHGLDRWVKGAQDAQGRAHGTWDLWRAPAGYTFVSHEQADFEHGVRRAFRELDDDRIEKEQLFDNAGKVVRTREWDEDGSVEEQETRADGVTVYREYAPPPQDAPAGTREGALRVERLESHGKLVVETWFDEHGGRMAEMIASEEKLVVRDPDDEDDEDEDDDEEEDDDEDDDDEAVEVESCRAFDASGALRAEGPVMPGRTGRPVGTWTIYENGAAIGTVDVAQYRITRDRDLGETAAEMLLLERTPTPRALAKIDKIDWAKYGTFFGRLKRFPQCLRAMAMDRVNSFYVGYNAIVDPILHQSTISEVTGPAYPYLCAVAGLLKTPALQDDLLELLARIATRDGSIGAANTIKQRYATRPAEKKKGPKHMAAGDLEGAYFHVMAAIDAHVATWARLAKSATANVRCWACVLLGMASSPLAVATLREVATSDKDPEIRGEALIALGLHRDAPLDELLRRAMAPDSPPSDRLCAALTWIRIGRTAPSPAAAILIDTLAGVLDTEDYRGTFLSAGPRSDAATTLTLLAPGESLRHLKTLCATLDQVSGVNAIAVARALLDVVFPEGYDEDEPVSEPQRMVLRTIAESDNAWRFNVNLHEALDDNGLPTDRDELRAIATGVAAPPRDDDGVMTFTGSAFGGPAEDLESFRRRRDGLDIPIPKGWV